MSSQRVIVFSGPPCSGKSTLAELYCAKHGNPLLQKDAFVARLFPGSSNSAQERQLAYRALHLAAEFLLNCRNNIVIDGVYELRDPREELESIIARTNSLLFVIACKVTPQEAAKRFTARPSGHPAVDLTADAVYQKALRYPFPSIGRQVDTSKGLRDCLADVEEYLSSFDPAPNGRWTESGLSTASVKD